MFNAVCMLRACTGTIFVVVNTRESLSGARLVVFGASSLSHFNTFHQILVQVLPFLSCRECPPFGEPEPPLLQLGPSCHSHGTFDWCSEYKFHSPADTYTFSIMPNYHTCIFTSLCGSFLSPRQSAQSEERVEL
jgi:hypothetical protein